MISLIGEKNANMFPILVAVVVVVAWSTDSTARRHTQASTAQSESREALRWLT